MSKQLATIVLLWSFVLLRTPVPIVGDLNNGTRCTVQDSPLRNELRSTATCSDYEAAVEFTSVSNTQETSVDYVCTSENITITGALWTKRTSNANVRFTVNVAEQLQPGMNCTFYVCYQFWQFSPTVERVYGRESPASCITDTDECATNNGGCGHTCNNTIGSFYCSCRTGYQLDRDGFNCSDINECENDNHICHENASCTNTEGSFTCSCNPGYTGDGVRCNDINECENDDDYCSEKATCTNTEGNFTCSCNPGYTGDGVRCTNINECNTANGGCEHRCIDTFGSFNCSCDIGYLLDRNGLNCSDINECDNNVDNCNENANCTNTEGSFTCSCNPGYTGDGIYCTNVNECQMDTYPCNAYANCTDTIGSFNCTCADGFEGNGFHCTASSEDTMFAITIVVVIIAVLSAVLCACVVIHAAHQFRREDTTMFTDKLYMTDVLDPKYFPISLDSVPKLSTIPSTTSMFDSLCNSVTQFSDTDTDSKSETQTTYQSLDTVLYDNTTDTADVVSDTGHINCQAPHNAADVSTHDTFLVTGSGISSTPYLNKGKEELCSLDLEKGDGTEVALSGGNSLVVSDAHAVSNMSANYLSSGDANGMDTSMSLKQSSDYIISEDLLVGSHRPLCTFDLDHVSESELPPSVGPETVFHDQQSLTFPNEGTENQETNELQSRPGYIPNSHLLSSVERNLRCQSPEGSTSPNVNRRGGLGTGMKPSPHHCRTPSESSLEYFNSIMHNQLDASSLSKMQCLSASSGYIVDCSGSRARENGQNLP